jgi:hypothetical protein
LAKRIEGLLEMDVKVYGVQALNRGHATKFYKEVANITGGFHLDLSQFSDVVISSRQYVISRLVAASFPGLKRN